MIRQLGPTLVALIVGIVLGRWFFGGGDDPGLPPLGDAPASAGGSAANYPTAAATGGALAPLPLADGDTRELLAELARRFEDERQARQALETRLDGMEQQLGSLEDQLAGVGESLDPETLANAAIAQTLEEFGEGGQQRDARQRAIQRFIDAGFSPQRAEELKARQDKAALDRLFLRDQARREGWLGTERYRDELNRINQTFQAMRDELGDDDYDRYLYATGRPNRVVVRDALTGGPGAQAGLQPGDAIISYDGERVFETRSLVERTQGGSFGAPTPIEVERNGERMVLYIPRGPLGVNMRSSVRKPGD